MADELKPWTDEQLERAARVTAEDIADARRDAAKASPFLAQLLDADAEDDDASTPVQARL